MLLLWARSFKCYAPIVKPAENINRWSIVNRAEHFRYFLIFSQIKNDFCIFIKLIWLGVGFLNRTGAEIGY